MVVSHNNPTAADNMDWVGWHKIGPILIHPLVQFDILSFGMMEFEAVGADELGEEGQVGVGQMHPYWAGFVAAILLK